MNRLSILICLLLCTLLPCAHADLTVRIGGDVYGGGNEGSVQTSNAADPTVAADQVQLTSSSVNATQVNIRMGNIRTVFGGGKNGRAFGQTGVHVSGGVIGDSVWSGTIHGGVFGAGDGAGAVVFGNDTVLITGGVLRNNVYGGGNQANLIGSTTVILRGGRYHGNVFGGSRMADIYGYAYVNLDGANVATDSTLIIPRVYGGNDVSGKIAASANWSWTQSMQMPFTPVMQQGGLHIIDGTWNAFVHASCKMNGATPVSDVNNIFVGEIYGGGNGDYAYSGTGTDLSVKLVNNPASGGAPADSVLFEHLSKPEVEKVYLDILNGTYGYLYGGGNNATVTGSVDICLYQQEDKTSVASIPASRIREMGLQEDIFTITGAGDAAMATPAYQFDRVFGGNNKATMAIRPNWYLVRATINNLYSGGNKGHMTAPKGLILPIASDGIYVNNCFGGCRMADVRPQQNGVDVASIPEETITSYKVNYASATPTIVTKPQLFEAGLAARVLVMGGHIDNVYGGNDISGHVYFGTNVAINGAVSGNIYGGGNGSYPYTDKLAYQSDPVYADYYYNPGSSSIDSLNKYRPHVENTLVHIWGEDLQKPVIGNDSTDIAAEGQSSGYRPVIVTGGVYCGGNSATLKGTGTPKAKFKIGKNVVINAVYLGSNGEEMVDTALLKLYKTVSTLNLSDSATFAAYMDGCAVDIKPEIEWEWGSGWQPGDAEPYAYIGSFYGGGNVGSVTYAKPITLDVPAGLKIFNRVVGGCRAADIPQSPYNAAYNGGLTVRNTGADASQPKLTLNMKAYLEPRNLIVTKSNRIFLESAKLPWNVQEYYKTETISADSLPTGTRLDYFKALENAVVYGGCFTSGMINGDVALNVTADLISPAVLAMPTSLLNGNSIASELKRMGNYAMTNTMLVYGGGYGEETVIKGDVRVTLSGNARLLSALGGAEEGVVEGSTCVTAAADLKDYNSDAILPFNAVAIYGGAYAGPIGGHTELTLTGGTFLNAFGGSCNADVEGYAATYIGDGQPTGFPLIKGCVYGGNDFGGYIKGYKDYSGTQAGYSGKTVRSPRYVEYLSGRIGDGSEAESAIYGGSYGSYDYTRYYWASAVLRDFGEADYAPDAPGVADEDKFHFPLADEAVATDGMAADAILTNTYVNIRSLATDPVKSLVRGSIYGGGRGVESATGIVDAEQTYVYLHSAPRASRTANLADKIYGGGYCSVVKNTRVDLLTGGCSFVYGGSYGASAADMNDQVVFNSDSTEVNLFTGMDNPNMSIFGGGGFTGAKATYVNLYGGTAGNVYGGSHNQGFCRTTHVIVPDASNALTAQASTAKVKALFGGGLGADVNLPCDEDSTNVIFASSTAYVSDAIYGGNHDKRAARTTNIDLRKPVFKAAGGAYAEVYGAGYGKNTVAGYTSIRLAGGVSMHLLYGGGRDGKVLGQYFNTVGAPDYYTAQSALHAHWLYQQPASTGDWRNKAVARTNTLITIPEGASADTVYAGGYGSDATVCGTTGVCVSGGSVEGTIFGGGFAGAVRCQQQREYGSEGGTLIQQDQAEVADASYTFIDLRGGKAGSVFGGGYDGNVGVFQGDEAETRLLIGRLDSTRYLDGSPAVLQSIYGGGYRGAVFGTAKVQMESGYIGYYYDGSAFKPNLYASAEDEQGLLRESGNIFAGGYGEGATTDRTLANMMGGTVRNSIYGGGEIASVGVAELTTIDTDNRSQIPDIITAGSTEVNIFGGLVEGNVFGGGRGYAIDAYGNTQTGDVGYSDGYTFGKTHVNVYRGTIGTDASLEEGNGNVFGGGNIGYVYGADATVSKTGAYASGSSFRNVSKHADGYYYRDGGSADGHLSEDCKVVISPAARVVKDTVFTVNDHTYRKGDWVMQTVLDSIPSTNARWNAFGNLDEQGIVIRNAVFAGGNVSAGSDRVYANTRTVYGNATASIVDCLQHDLITLGEDEIGGLYGDGNLTFVDGYRELNITNYGTDYYSLGNKIEMAEYERLNARERAYFEVKYECVQANPGFSVGDQISASQYEALEQQYQTSEYWQPAGFCTLYAGRMLNTIQRADFCGVFGSRMVLKGAQDRVPSQIDYTKYTINRVGELSLNQVKAPQPGELDHTNGCYFGIYSVVNYLGALTSDVSFRDAKRTTESDVVPADGKTYFEWKEDKLDNRYRNNGTAKNKVALAAGVWLEVVKKKAESAQDKDVYGSYEYTPGEKIYGPITGIIELDLINASTGEGGGYVYALNQHGELQSATTASQTTLTDANRNAISYKQFSYKLMDADDKMETSGNFINSVKRIVDDCFPYSSSWLLTSAAVPTSKAHYWFVQGDFYVYDTYISAYTGSAQAYAESIEVPLTLTTAALGRLQMVNVQQNRNAYWTDTQYAALDGMYKDQTDSTIIIVGGTKYHKNEPISYWDWAHLTPSERTLFITGTYVCNLPVDSIPVGGAYLSYAKDQVLDSTAYKAVATALAGKYYVEKTITTSSAIYPVGTCITSAQYNLLTPTQRDNCRPAVECFAKASALDEDNGFLLTHDWSNPDQWGDYYIRQSNHAASDMATAAEKTDQHTLLGPTFEYAIASGEQHLLGQSDYVKGALIGSTAYSNQRSDAADHTSAPQASFEVAYVAKELCQFEAFGTTYTLVKGTAITDAFYRDTVPADEKADFDEAYICMQTYQVSDDKYIISGDLITEAEFSNLPQEEKDNFEQAYVCTSDGKWGGKLYTGGQNYEALDYCALSASERTDFKYNLDALETLRASADAKHQYPDDMLNYITKTSYSDGTQVNNYDDRHTGLYMQRLPVEYTAVFADTLPSWTLPNGLSLNVTHADGTTTRVSSLVPGDVLSRVQFEDSITNEQSKFVQLATVAGVSADYRLINQDFWIGDTWYGAGTVITDSVWNQLSTANQAKTSDKFTVDGTGEPVYVCKEAYTSSTELGAVQKLAVITKAAFATLPNDQARFRIAGEIPTETATLYVARETNLEQLSQDKIITVIYQYSYQESNEDHTAYETIMERHIVNVRVHFESGVPTIGELMAPPVVLPGSKIGLNLPSVAEGAYTILGGGWEIYANSKDAEAHTNGSEYVNNSTPMYWYQNGYQVAYYAKSYLGKTYSNSVPVTVANYHRMSEVMTSTHMELRVDTINNRVDSVLVRDYMYLNDAGERTATSGNYQREAKVYIGSDAELGQLRQFFDTTALATDSSFHFIRGCKNIDFIIDKDIAHSGNWNPLGADTLCFGGNIHGDGHVISGLDQALFDYLCGNVYNLGVSGTFPGAGIANHGSSAKAVNCWTVSRADAVSGYPVFGDGNGQAVNCYYFEGNRYPQPAPALWTVYAKPMKAFLNGEVAYQLNSYYLEKRRQDAISHNTADDQLYYYWTLSAPGTLNSSRTAAYYTPGTDSYVETRFANEDFIYAGGNIPIKADKRKFIASYYPVFPDDYLFFGQSLSYGSSASDHDDHPQAILRHADAPRLLVDRQTSTRVYRTPAYYKSSVRQTAYHNAAAAYKAAYKPAVLWGDTTVLVYDDLTALDYTGYNDTLRTDGSSQSLFYAPVLDYDSLDSYKTNGLTQNLLVYADKDADASSYAVVSAALPEPALEINNEGSNWGSGRTWNDVAVPSLQDSADVKGHLIHLPKGKRSTAGTSYAIGTAYGDHYLVDRQNFNCPIAFRYADDHRMWYQRKPDLHVGKENGWEAISLPFEVKLVSTQSKGEITHFYSDGSGQYVRGCDSGHEYWLRRLTGSRTVTVSGSDTEVPAFGSLTKQGSEDKLMPNTFLWDYYYSIDSRKDNNADIYQQYYNQERTFAGYPYQQAGTPYLVGFPGKRFYEFDLSGQFVPQYRDATTPIAQLPKQTISFLSAENASIAVSDGEMQVHNAAGYYYKPTYLGLTIPAGSYVINADGSSFRLTTAQEHVDAFRAYFGTTAPSPAPSFDFGGVTLDKGGEPADSSDRSGGLRVFARDGEIVVVSDSDEQQFVQLQYVSGIKIASAYIEPGETLRFPVNQKGIYLVNRIKVLVAD